MTQIPPFESLPAPLRRALQEKGFEALTPVQLAVAAHMAEEESAGGANFRISSQTGSGKTVALGLALAPSLIELAEASAPRAGPAALIITPTRELAVQVHKELAWLFAHVPGIAVEVVTGGTDVRREKQKLRARPAVLVGTPGRLLDHQRSGALDTATTHQVVLDEADQMLDMGFRDELDAIVDALPSERRSHLVSATFSEAVRALAHRFQGEGVRIEGTALGQANSDIEHSAYLIRPAQRYPALVNLLLQSHGERTLVFVRTRAETAELSEKLAGDGFSALPFSGELAQAQRTRTLDAFRNGIITALIATDVAARGIDVPAITTVIHTDLPGEADVYTHRSGRTGRAGKTGRSLLLVPFSGQRRARRLLQDAGIEATWQPVPTPKKIRQSITKATRRELFRRLSEPTLAEPELQYAQSLLEKVEPAKVIATLLSMAEAPLPRAPFEVDAVDPAWVPPRTERSGPRGGATVRFTPFLVSWGAKHGANPSRCMSHVCRRGGVSRREVGAIRVDVDSTVVEISEDAAQRFEAAVREPDARDPHVTITRLGSNGGPRGRGGPRGAKLPAGLRLKRPGPRDGAGREAPPWAGPGREAGRESRARPAREGNRRVTRAAREPRTRPRPEES